MSSTSQISTRYLSFNKLSPSLRVVLDVSVQVAELLHGREHLEKKPELHRIPCNALHLDGSPSNVADEVNRTCDVRSSREPGILDHQSIFPQNDPPEEEVQLERVDLVFHQQDLERHLGGEDQLVALEQTPERWKVFF